MNRASLMLAISLVAAGVSRSGAAPITKSLPYVGTIQTIDLEGRSIVLLGPDGQELELAMPPMLMVEGVGRIEFEELEGKEGARLGAFLKDLNTARLAVLLDDWDEPMKVYVRAVRPKAQAVEFTTSDGFMERIKPAVNLGAVAAEGEAPVRASWDWFEARQRKSFYLRTVQLFGMVFIWDVRPWDPKADEDEAEEGAGEAGDP